MKQYEIKIELGDTEIRDALVDAGFEHTLANEKALLAEIAAMVSEMAHEHGMTEEAARRI